MTDRSAPAAAPSLPVTLRPRWGRRVPYAVAAALVAAAVGIAVVLPTEGVLGGDLPDRVMFVLLGLAGASLLHRLAAVRVDADVDGLTVRNYLRTHRLEWAEVLGVRMGPGQPWLVLDVSDGSSLPVMGVQGSDGELAARQALDLARLVAERTRVARDD